MRGYRPPDPTLPRRDAEIVAACSMERDGLGILGGVQGPLTTAWLPTRIPAELVPAKASIRSVLVESDAPAVAQASRTQIDNISVSGFAPGSTAITVTSSDGGHAATCRVIVSPEVNIASEATITTSFSFKWGPQNVADRNTKTSWLAGAQTDTRWIKLEWPKAREVCRVVIHGPNSGDIVFSDGSIVDLLARGMNEKTVRKEISLDAPKRTTWIEYRIKKVPHPYAYQVQEIEVYEKTTARER